MRYGLIGEHLTHSFSREIHGRVADYEYELCELAPDELDGFMKRADFRAINVTIPYKQAVIPYLYYISDRAKSIGAVNTVVNRDGRLYGYNTDFAGMEALFGYIGVSPENKKVLILGTGGTSKTAHAVAESLGAREVLHASRKSDGCSVSYEEAVSLHSDAEIIINTTPVGMFPKNEGTPIDIAAFPGLCALVDVVYNPLRTNLVLDAQERGIPAAGGLYMLSGQGVAASAIFLGRDADESLYYQTFASVRNEKRNVVLIGMPSCGKTTVGSVLASQKGKPLVDTDELIVERIGEPIADFMRKNGEAAFRDIESEVIAQVSKLSGVILSTGGGAVLRRENVRALRQNGILVFLDRDPENLITTDDRPLSSSREALRKRYEERYDIYRASADVIVDANADIDTVAEAVRRESEK